METIADSKKCIREMRSELVQQVDTARWLAVTFAESAIQLIRYDQVARLGILKSRIMEEVDNIKRIESAAQMGFSKGALLDGVTVFTFSSLFMAAKGRKDAFETGLRLVGSVLSRKILFGTVLITIDGQGIPEGVKVVSISRLARESSKRESEVIANFRNNGYLCMAPETFAQVLYKAECGILDGSLSLPINIDKLTKQISKGC